MPFIFEQPNLDVSEESLLYFAPGAGRLMAEVVLTAHKIIVALDDHHIVTEGQSMRYGLATQCVRVGQGESSS